MRSYRPPPALRRVFLLARWGPIQTWSTPPL
jgi:hypothetical protein